MGLDREQIEFDRQMIERFFLDGLQCAQIAEILILPEERVKDEIERIKRDPTEPRIFNYLMLKIRDRLRN